MIDGYLTDNVKITKVKDHSAADTASVACTGVDMAGYDGVLFLTSFGTANANNVLKVQQSSDDGSSDAYDDLLGTSVASGSSDEDVWYDLTRPGKQYVRPYVVRGTSSTLESVWAVQYKARAKPITNSVSGTIIGEQGNALAEGTA